MASGKQKPEIERNKQRILMDIPNHKGVSDVKLKRNSNQMHHGASKRNIFEESRVNIGYCKYRKRK